MDEYVEALFLKECKGRFLGKVLINGGEEECYISSSSRLSKYVNLVNHKVLLKHNKGSNLRTCYTLYAVEKDENIILLNLNDGNEIYYNYLINKGIESGKIKREYKFENGLKTDLLYNNCNVVEVKSIVTDNIQTNFPGENSKRLDRQLDLYLELLIEGKEVEFALILFNNKVTDIFWNKRYQNICNKFFEAMKLGMKLNVYKAKFKNGDVSVEKSQKLTDELSRDLKKQKWKGREVMDAVCFTETMLNYESNLEATYKKNNGIFYTDLFLADKIVKNLKLSKDKVILDPCCGTGSFVMAALSQKYKNVYGADQDNAAIELCKDYTGSSKVFCTDTLGTSGENVIKKMKLIEKADAVVGNPPYATLGDGVAIQTTDYKFSQKIYSSGNNLFVAAMYRAFEMVKEGGIVSYIIPKNFLHVSSYSVLRKFILKNKKIVSIVDLGAYFKNVRGEQIIITIKNETPEDKSKIKISCLLNSEFEKSTLVEQRFYNDEILLFRSKEDFRIYKKMISAYERLENVCEGYVGRGKSKAKEAIIGKDIRKFGYKHKDTPDTGNKIFIQNIYSAEAGIIAAFGGNYEASQTVTVFTDGNENTCRYVLGILHSKLCNFYLFKYCYNNSRLTMHTDAKYLKKLPLIPYGSRKTVEIVNQVKKIEKTEYLSDKWYDYVEDLDNMVFKLFKLTDLEIQFVKEEMKKIQSKRWFKDAK